MKFLSTLTYPELASLIAFTVLMIAAAVNDLLTMKIPNRINILIAGSYIITAVATRTPAATILVHAAVGLVAMLILMVPFSRGWMGGGDVKMISASIIWFSPEFIFGYLLLISIFGGILTLAIIFSRSLPLLPFVGQYQNIQKFIWHDGKIPYGAAIGAGGIAAKFIEYQGVAL